MQVIPVINCVDFKCVRRHLKKASKIGSPWVHIDVADGRFTRTITWQNPEDLIKERKKFSLRKLFLHFFLHREPRPEPQLEVHLMVDSPEAVLENWLKAGAKRVIIHAEAVAATWLRLLAKCEEYKVRLMAAVEPETPLDNLVLTLSRYDISAVQILAVRPGPAGQKFDGRVLDKVRALKKELPNLTIEVDGGINPETARLAKEAGADIITSSAYIWDNFNHKKAFERLRNI